MMAVCAAVAAGSLAAAVFDPHPAWLAAATLNGAFFTVEQLRSRRARPVTANLSGGAA